jgi:prepilin-type N-terminal cleavage/methylation domain-containing protein
MKTPSARANISGLTLLETLVVVSVIAILAAFFCRFRVDGKIAKECSASPTSDKLISA